MDMQMATPREAGETYAQRPAIRGTRHMASAGHYGAAHAAFAILEAGGNAVDAAVAGGIALGVLQPDIVNVAGVAPIMIRLGLMGEIIQYMNDFKSQRQRHLGFFNGFDHLKEGIFSQHCVPPRAF